MINQKMYELGNKASTIRELFEYGKMRKAQIGEENVFDFSLGNPSVPAPYIVNNTLINLLQTKDTNMIHGYTSATGDNEVRKSIATYLNEKYNTCVDDKLIYMTVGAAAALTISLNALLNPNEEVIVFAPYFPEYRVFTEKAGGILKVVKCVEPNFIPDFDAFEKVINKNTKVIIINSPNNPTGVIWDKETIQKIAYILEQKEKEYNHPIYILSDEPYRELVYSDKEVPFITNYYDNTIIGYSFSKSLSLPGERIGYVLVGPKCEDKEILFKAICGAGRSLGFVCAPSSLQYMRHYCLGYTANLDAYIENKTILEEALTSYGYEIVKPEGAFYLFVKALEPNAMKFSEYAKKYELLLVPSDSFGYEGYIRISYCVSKEQIINSLPYFKQLIEDYKEAKHE